MTEFLSTNNHKETNEMEYNLAICDFIVKFLGLNNSCLNVSNDKTKNFENSTVEVMYLVDLCYKIESNLVYFSWLLTLFTPLLKFFLCLFLTPFLISSYFYIFSLILTFKKHWHILKVNISFSNEI